MSRQEDEKRLVLTEGPTRLLVSEKQTHIQHGGGQLDFANIEDFLEFVNRLSILAVRLDQTINKEPGQENPPAGDAGPET